MKVHTHVLTKKNSARVFITEYWSDVGCICLLKINCTLWTFSAFSITINKINSSRIMNSIPKDWASSSIRLNYLEWVLFLFCLLATTDVLSKITCTCRHFHPRLILILAKQTAVQHCWCYLGLMVNVISWEWVKRCCSVSGHSLCQQVDSNIEISRRGRAK